MSSAPHPLARPDSDTKASPRLLADIGGTNARFALQYDTGDITSIQTLAVAAYPEFTAAVQAYLDSCGKPPVRHAAVAIANPVQGDQIQMTNHDWSFSIEASRRQLKLDSLLIVNDFTALSMAVPRLRASDYRQVGGGQPREREVIGLVGAGTGLGVGGLIHAANGWQALASEGGHVAFAAADEREAALLAYCRRHYSHVSAERLISGPGIETIFQGLHVIHGLPPAAAMSTPDIVQRALAGDDALCSETLDCFCAMLGTFAANLAVTLGARGGIYIGGGVVPRLGAYFDHSPFRSRFEQKGRFSTYMQAIPTYVITAPYPALIGAAALLDAATPIS